jgi:acetylornithine deacetylase/succinyl-diaminopimelate desuccinylase-like protein
MEVGLVAIYTNRAHHHSYKKKNKEKKTIMSQIYDNYLKYLKDFISIKSISTDSSYKNDITDAVDWLNNIFTENKFDVEIFKSANTNPIVYANYSPLKDAQTILIYGHYDVQPAELEQGWTNNPFELELKEKELIGRGVVDNKGQILIHIVSVFDLIQKGKLKYNIKFLIEGNEETGNEDLPKLLESNCDKLKSDFVLISDGEIIEDFPVIEGSLRGGMNITLTLTTAKNDVHAGKAASDFVSHLYNELNQVSYEEFYRNVDIISSDQLSLTQKIDKYSIKLLEQIEVIERQLEPDQNFFSQTGLRPTIQITGIKTGYTGEGYANIVPAKAEIRMNFRTVASQKIDEVYADFESYVKSVIPKYINYKIEVYGKHEPIKLNIDSHMHKNIMKLLEEVYQKEVYVKFVGGAVPFVSDVKRILGLDAILVPLGNDDCNMHGPNENFKIDLINKGISFSQKLFGIIDHSN